MHLCACLIGLTRGLDVSDCDNETARMEKKIKKKTTVSLATCSIRARAKYKNIIHRLWFSYNSSNRPTDLIITSKIKKKTHYMRELPQQSQALSVFRDREFSD